MGGAGGAVVEGEGGGVASLLEMWWREWKEGQSGEKRWKSEADR